MTNKTCEHEETFDGTKVRCGLDAIVEVDRTPAEGMENPTWLCPLHAEWKHLKQIGLEDLHMESVDDMWGPP